MRPIEPAIVDQERDENHRQDFQAGPDDGKSADTMEAEEDRLPREQGAQLATPQTGSDAERQGEESCGQADQDVHAVVAQAGKGPWEKHPRSGNPGTFP